MANATTPVIQINEGNVGIGTTTPLAKLDIQGTQGQLFSVTDDLSGSIFAVADISGVPIFDVNSSGLSTFDGNVTVDGNVGIGTTSPSTKLEIKGDATSNDTAQLVVASGGVDNNSIIHFSDDDGGQITAIGALEGNILTLASLNELVFKTGTGSILGSTNTKMTILTNGNVGINETNPGVKLQLVSADEQLTKFSSSVADQLAYSQINANSSTSGGITAAAALELVGKANGSGHGRHAWIGAEGTSNTTLLTKLKFKVRGQTASGYDWAGAAEAPTIMTLEGDGNVGIGVDGPLARLHVNQGTVSGTIIKATGIQAQIEIQTSTAGDAHLYMRPNSTGNNAAIFKMTAGTNYNWRWQDDATTPVVFMQLSQSNSSLSVKGDIIAYGSPSDERYKENIKPIESALDKVTKLQGVTFDWKKSDNLLDIKEDIGFIAQDVQKVVPELVRENEDGKLSLRYQGITPILLEAIKELKAEIEELKKQIK